MNLEMTFMFLDDALETLRDTYEALRKDTARGEDIDDLPVTMEIYLQGLLSKTALAWMSMGLSLAEWESIPESKQEEARNIVPLWDDHMKCVSLDKAPAGIARNWLPKDAEE